MSDDLVKWLRNNPHQGRTEMLKLRAEIERQGARIAELEAGLDAMQDAYELRAELFTSDEDCAANLYDRIRLLIKKEGEDG